MHQPSLNQTLKTSTLALLATLSVGIAFPAVAGDDLPNEPTGPTVPGDIKIHVEEEEISIHQETDPHVTIHLAADLSVMNSDNTLANDLKAKWGIDSLCAYQLDDFTVTHPDGDNWDTKTEPRVNGRITFGVGAYFFEQTYNINTPKDFCTTVASGNAYPGFSPNELDSMWMAFHILDGQFTAFIDPTANDVLHLKSRCLDLVNNPTLDVDEFYDPQPLKVTCCNGSASTCEDVTGTPRTGG